MRPVSFLSRLFVGTALVAALVLPGLPALAAPAAPAAGSGGVSTGLKETADAAFGTAPKADLATIVGTIIRSAIAFVGLLFMVLIVYGGFLWMTSAGNPQTAEKARGIIIAAVIGMFIIGGGYAITDFVIKAVQNATLGASATP